MMIGSFSGIPYRHFLERLGPVALIGLALAVVVILIAYRSEFASPEQVQVEKRAVPVSHWLMAKAMLVTLGMLVMFFAGWPVPKVAVVAGAILLITRRVDPEQVYRSIDWGLLVMFVGLFIVVAGIEKTQLQGDLIALAAGLHLDNVFILSGFTAGLSNLVSNVPAVLVFKPLAAHVANPAQTWLTLAMSSTLAGNLTLLGSVANLIVIQQSRHKVKISFWEHFRVGAPLAVVTILIGAAWITYIGS